MILTQNGRLLIGNAPPTESTFALDVNGTGQFSGSVTASSFIKSGGTSSQFLKADGSVDSTTYVPIGRTITINGTTQDLSADRTFNVGTVTSVTASSPLLSSGGATPNITIQQASGSQNGFLSSTDWTTFNNKAAAGNYVTLDTTQTITAQKTFSLDIIVNGVNVGKGGGNIISNVRIGNGSLLDNTSGSSNTAIGFSSLSLNTSGASNTGLGTYTLLNNTIGASNTALGFSSMIANTIGNQNTAIGDSSLGSNTSGSQNTAVGRASLFTNTTANNNTSIGFFALYYNTTGSENTATGSQALFQNTTGSNNTSVGYYSLVLNTTGINNTAVGFNALANHTTGNNQVALGLSAGRYINSGANNVLSNSSIYIGADSRASASGNANEIVIGHEGRGNGSNSVTIGNTSITKTILNGNVGIFTASPTTGKLVVKSGESNSTGIVLERGDNTDKLVNIFSETADGKIAIASGGTTKIFLDSVGASYFTGGNLLVGTSTNGASKLRLVGLPTSSAGLSSGDVYNLAGVLMIA
jgi:hypothetical protein